MEQVSRHPHLRLIHGGEPPAGPVTRLGLRERLHFYPQSTVALLIVTKMFLLAGILYYLYG